MSSVLFVDDNKVNQHVVRLLLQDMDLAVHAVESGSEAVAAFEANHFDLVFLDCQISENDGCETCKTIKQIQQRKGINIPVIAMTANEACNNDRIFLVAGMDACISKPIDPVELVQMVRRFLTEIKTGQNEASNAHETDENSPVKTLDVKLLHCRFSHAGIKEVLRLFMATAPDEVANIQGMLACQAYPEVQRQAHSLKGSSATICADGLVKICRELEAAATAADKRQCDIVLGRLDSCFRSTLSEIDECLSVLH